MFFPLAAASGDQITRQSKSEPSTKKRVQGERNAIRPRFWVWESLIVLCGHSLLRRSIRSEYWPDERPNETHSASADGPRQGGRLAVPAHLQQLLRDRSDLILGQRARPQAQVADGAHKAVTAKAEVARTNKRARIAREVGCAGRYSHASDGGGGGLAVTRHCESEVESRERAVTSSQQTTALTQQIPAPTRGDQNHTWCRSRHQNFGTTKSKTHSDKVEQIPTPVKVMSKRAAGATRKP